MPLFLNANAENEWGKKSLLKPRLKKKWAIMLAFYSPRLFKYQNGFNSFPIRM